MNAVPTIVEFSTPNIDVTFPAPIVLKGIPQWRTNTSKLPITCTQLSAVSFRLAYDTPGSVTSVSVPQNDPAIRTSTGGYVPQGSFQAT